MDAFDLSNRFKFHPAVTAQKQEDHDSVRSLFYEISCNLDLILPEGREKSLAITKLEEAMFWSNAAVARNA